MICLLLFLCSCDSQSDSSTSEKNSIVDSTLNKKNDSSTNEKVAKARQSDVFEDALGRWVFVKRFLAKERSFDAPSFTILKRKIESAGYAYFVHFEDGQDELLLKMDDNKLTYGDNVFAIFEYDPSTDHLFVKIRETSDAEYKRSN